MNNNLLACTFALMLLTGCAEDSTPKDDSTTDNTGSMGSGGSTQNQSPTADAGTNKTAEVNQSITLLGSGTDNDGSISSYSWKENGKSLSSSPSLNYTSSEIGNHTLTFTVTDDKGAIASDSIVITVTKIDAPVEINKSPTANAGTDRTVEEGKSITILGSGTDTDGSISSYSWKENGQPLSSNQSLNYTSTEIGNHTLTFTVTDNKGAIDSDSIVVTVTKKEDSVETNKSPTAHAGTNKTTKVNQPIALSGSGTDTDGTISAYSWKEGSTVISTKQAFDYTPAIVGNHTLTLTVTDNNGATGSASMIVTAVSSTTPSGSDANIARLFGIATQGKTYGGETADRAIDGDLSTANHTECNSTDNWWQVELPDKVNPMQISKVVVYNRVGQEARMNGTEMFLGNTPSTGSISGFEKIATLTTARGAQTFNFTNKSGRYLLLKNNRGNCLHTPEVEVYGQVSSQPYFSANSYSATINQYQSKTQNFFNIKAIDYQGETIQYSLTDNSQPFSIDDKGNLFVTGLLEIKTYDISVIASDGINQTQQAINITVTGGAQTVELQRINDATPEIVGYLPNTYQSGDNVTVTINNNTYIALVDEAKGTWTIPDNDISPRLSLTTYDVTLNTGGKTIIYTDFIEIYGSMQKEQDFTLSMNTIDTITINVQSSVEQEFKRNDRIRGNSVALSVNSGVVTLINKSYRKLGSLLAKYTDGGNEVLVKLKFDRPIEPFTSNNLQSFSHAADMSIVTTANYFNATFSADSSDACDSRQDGNTGLIVSSHAYYCKPTFFDNEETFSDRSTGQSELKNYGIALASYSHFYNTKDSLKTMQAWTEKRDFQGITLSGDYQQASEYIFDESDPVAWMHDSFFHVVMPNWHTGLRTMRYFYAAQGMGGGRGSNIYGSDITFNGWASVFEGAIKYNDDSYGLYDTLHHEIMHSIGYNHDSGMSYGWSHAMMIIIKARYTAGVAPTVEVPKYIFSHSIDGDRIQITAHKTTDATQNNLTFDLFSSAPQVDDDWHFETASGDAVNQITLVINNVTERFFLRIFGSDSGQVMSVLIDR